MNSPITFTGPLEKAGDQWRLRVPLAAGGSGLADCCRGISDIQNNILNIEIGEWIVAQLGLSEGSLVEVSDNDGKFTIRAATEK